jgi:hypothetical protein
VCKWILAAYCSVSPKIVEESFKVTGISDEMKGSGDFMIKTLTMEVRVMMMMMMTAVLAVTVNDTIMLVIAD